LNGDGRIGLHDLVLFRQHLGTASGAQPGDGDLDGDGDVDRADLMRLVENYGRTSASQSSAAVAGRILDPSHRDIRLRAARTSPIVAQRTPAVDALMQRTDWCVEALTARRLRTRYSRH
jgi:hypothetical protein